MEVNQKRTFSINDKNEDNAENGPLLDHRDFYSFKHFKEMNDMLLSAKQTIS